MAEVKWIKIVTDIFDDEKIALIEAIPDADSIIVIWFKLLCFAGKSNNGGVFQFNGMAYTDSMLSTIFRRKENTVKLALQTFERFGMVEIINDTITIPNWDKHQNFAKLDEMREYNRLAKQNERDRKKTLMPNVNDMSMTCQECQSTDRDIDIDIDIDKEVDRDIDVKESIEKKPLKLPRKKNGEYNHVLLTEAELLKLQTDYGEKVIAEYIKKIDEYCQMNGKTYKDYNLAIRNWINRDGEKTITNQSSNPFKNLVDRGEFD